MKILLWGTFDKGKPRNRNIAAALASAGAEVSEVHANIWQGVRDKSQLGRASRLARYARWLLAYPGLIFRFLTSERPDVVLVGYPGQIDVLLLWPLAKLRRVPVALDLFISLYDTTVTDRGLVLPSSLKARLIWMLERLSLRAADKVFLDTASHARHIETLYNLPDGTLGAFPVGVERRFFPIHPPPEVSDRPKLLFYGQLIPLHGIGTVTQAALSDEGRKFDWTIVGSGQDTPVVEAALQDQDSPHIAWHRWVDYAELSSLVGRADICLGIFGTSQKAASVIPNKVYQCLASGRHVVTRRSPAMEEIYCERQPGLTLVEAGSPEALMKGIEDAVATGCQPPDPELSQSFSPDEIGHSIVSQLRKITR